MDVNQLVDCLRVCTLLPKRCCAGNYCIYYGTLDCIGNAFGHLDAADAIEVLQTQLDESQRREQAAVKDIKHPSVCERCKSSCQGDYVCIDNGYMCFDWRGPQE